MTSITPSLYWDILIIEGSNVLADRVHSSEHLHVQCTYLMVQVRHSQRGQGENFLTVYADDFIAGFQYKWEAEKYYRILKERMEKFGLELTIFILQGNPAHAFVLVIHTYRTTKVRQGIIAGTGKEAGRNLEGVF